MISKAFQWLLLPLFGKLRASGGFYKFIVILYRTLFYALFIIVSSDLVYMMNDIPVFEDAKSVEGRVVRINSYRSKHQPFTIWVEDESRIFGDSIPLQRVRKNEDYDTMKDAGLAEGKLVTAYYATTWYGLFLRRHILIDIRLDDEPILGDWDQHRIRLLPSEQWEGTKALLKWFVAYSLLSLLLFRPQPIKDGLAAYYVK